MNETKLVYLTIVLAISFGVTVMSEPVAKKTPQTEIATLAGGCFWCMQPPFDSTKGVLLTRVGYVGGHTKNPTYADITTGKTGHAEAIEIVFDPSLISYSNILDIFWKNIDPTTLNQQFADKGTQYRTAIFYHSDLQKKHAEASKKALDATQRYDKKIVTEITPVSQFYVAEDEHQKYYEKNVLHYQFYKVGSGRDAYLKRVWKD